jgi:hypothetical protein
VGDAVEMALVAASISMGNVALEKSPLVSPSTSIKPFGERIFSKSQTLKGLAASIQAGIDQDLVIDELRATVVAAHAQNTATTLELKETMHYLASEKRIRAMLDETLDATKHVLDEKKQHKPAVVDDVNTPLEDATAKEKQTESQVTTASHVEDGCCVGERSPSDSCDDAATEEQVTNEAIGVEKTEKMAGETLYVAAEVAAEVSTDGAGAEVAAEFAVVADTPLVSES